MDRELRIMEAENYAHFSSTEKSGESTDTMVIFLRESIISNYLDVNKCACGYV